MRVLQHVTESDFGDEVLGSAVPVLVDFYADWCGPCRALSPVLERLAQEFAGQVKIVKVNVDTSPQLAGYFRIQSIPTLLTFRDGQVVDKLVGVGAPGQLRSLLTKLSARVQQVAWS